MIRTSLLTIAVAFGAVAFGATSEAQAATVEAMTALGAEQTGTTMASASDVSGSAEVDLVTGELKASGFAGAGSGNTESPGGGASASIGDFVVSCGAPCVGLGGFFDVEMKVTGSYIVNDPGFYSGAIGGSLSATNAASGDPLASAFYTYSFSDFGAGFAGDGAATIVGNGGVDEISTDPSTFEFILKLTDLPLASGSIALSAFLDVNGAGVTLDFSQTAILSAAFDTLDGVTFSDDVNWISGPDITPPDNVIPIPGAALLFLSGLLGMSAVRRRG